MIARIVGTLLLGSLAAWLAQALHFPLPWMTGPLLVCAIAGMAGLPLRASELLRNVGQGLIGVALGLHFTTDVLSTMLRLAPAIGLGAAWALLLGWVFHLALRRRHPAEAPATTFFAAAIGGASEMTLLAESHGGRVDRVAAAHSLRVAIVVVGLPFLFQTLGVRGVDVTLPATGSGSTGGLPLLAGLAAAGILVASALRLANPWLLGALAATAAGTAFGAGLPALPGWASAAGQLFIGVALGARFTPDFARSGPAWLASVALGTLALLVGAAGLAGVLAWWLGLHPATLLLGNSPGGIAEMCITADVLRLGVPTVTAFHVARYLTVLLCTPALFHRELRRLAARG